MKIVAAQKNKKTEWTISDTDWLQQFLHTVFTVLKGSPLRPAQNVYNCMFFVKELLNKKTSLQDRVFGVSMQVPRLGYILITFRGKPWASSEQIVVLKNCWAKIIKKNRMDNFVHRLKQQISKKQ